VESRDLENLLVVQESVLEIGDSGLWQKLGTGLLVGNAEKLRASFP